MNNIMKFENHNVEVFELNGQVLFNPYHCGECLELNESSVRNHLSKMNSKQAVLIKNSDVLNKDIRKLNNAGEKFLTESGVYKLIFKSKKKEAERFQDWVTDEVLPSIRKTGSYSIDNQVKLLEDKNNKLEEEIQELKEAVNLSIQQFKPSHRTKLQYSKLIRNLTSTDEEYKFIKEWVFSCMNITKWEDVCVQDDKKVREIIFTVARLSIINKMEQLSFDIGDEA